MDVDALASLDHHGLAEQRCIVAPSRGLFAWQDLAFADLSLNGVVDVVAFKLVWL